MAERLTGLAPAKVNLVLEVTGVREDGYHEMDTVLQTLELADSVTVEHGSPGVTVEGPCAGGTPADETNLAWRAAQELARRVGADMDSIHLTIEKRIPVASGLGGGASDAATTLRLLQRWWSEAKDVDVFEAANAAGSDEAFFLIGGTARARGRGEEVSLLPDLPRHGVMLFIPAATIEGKTGRMFRALDRYPLDNGAVARAFVARRPARLGSADVFNAFERVAFDVFPGLAAICEDVERRIGEPVRLAGAGPTLFWIGPEHESARVAAAAQGATCTVIATATARSLWRP